MVVHLFPSRIFPWMVAVALSAATVPFTSASAQDTEPKAAQPVLGEQPLTISGAGQKHQFTVELARTPREQEIGLMFRENIPAGHGMLFVWPRPQEAAMWMKNCPVPEDMVFIGLDNRIIHIAENTVPFSLAEIRSDGVAKATLELRGGETARLGITVGDQVTAKELYRLSPG